MSNDKKPDFSNVQSGANTRSAGGESGTLAGARPDFSNVVSGADTVPGTPAGSARSYTIEEGDTLSAIAQRVYGKAKYWRQIHEANRAEIENPDRIYPGQVITLPAIDTDGDGTPDDPAAA
jgi:nucleoid-associated protein YgaU